MEWYENVGLPSTVEADDAYWKPYYAAANHDEATLIEGEARTPAGLAAKAACLWSVRGLGRGLNPDFPDGLPI